MWMPGDALVAPGPRVTNTMPGRPVALPCASAIMVAPPSWRQTVSCDRPVVEGVERGEIAFAGHAEHVLHAVRDKLIDQDLAAGPGAVIGAHCLFLRTLSLLGILTYSTTSPVAFEASGALAQCSLPIQLSSCVMES